MARKSSGKKSTTKKKTARSASDATSKKRTKQQSAPADLPTLLPWWVEPLEVALERVEHVARLFPRQDIEEQREWLRRLSRGVGIVTDNLLDAYREHAAEQERTNGVRLEQRKAEGDVLPISGEAVRMRAWLLDAAKADRKVRRNEESLQLPGLLAFFRISGAITLWPGGFFGVPPYCASSLGGLVHELPSGEIDEPEALQWVLLERARALMLAAWVRERLTILREQTIPGFKCIDNYVVRVTHVGRTRNVTLEPSEFDFVSRLVKQKPNATHYRSGTDGYLRLIKKLPELDSVINTGKKVDEHRFHFTMTEEARERSSVKRKRKPRAKKSS